jgi:hypothetical protein
MTKRIKDKSSTNDLQNTKQKTKHWAATNSTKNHEWTYVPYGGMVSLLVASVVDHGFDHQLGQA